MIGKVADAFSKMPAVERFQEQHSGNQVIKNDQINLNSFEKSIIQQHEKVKEVVDTYQSRKIKDDDESKKHKKEQKKREEDDSEDEDSQNIKHIDEKA